MNKIKEIIYETENLQMFSIKKQIELLSTDNGFFVTAEGQLIGNIVVGYCYREKNRFIIEPQYEEVIQILPDGSKYTWKFTEEGYFYE